MRVRADIAEMLRAGVTDAGIVRELHVRRATVAAARAALGIPKTPGGRRAAGSVEDLFWRRVQFGEDGHMTWGGYRNTTGAPGLRWGGTVHSAYRVAFRMAIGREPVGKVLPSCGFAGCVAPAHQLDRAGRAEEKRLERLYAGIFGASA